MDDFNSPLLNTNKWVFSEDFSQNFVHTNGYITFQSTDEITPQNGYIFWKEKMSLSNNWNAKIQSYINPSFVPSGVPIAFPRPPLTESNGIVLNGVIETAIGITDTLSGSNYYANLFLKGNNNQTYFNPNYTLNSGENIDSKFHSVISNKVLLEINYDSNTKLLYSNMYDYSGDSLGSIIGWDSFDVSQFGSVNEVYVFVGGDTWTTIAPQGSATLDNFEIVPEPSALSLLAVGLGVLFRRSRKRD